jgi:hypothetical protein
MSQRTVISMRKQIIITVDTTDDMPSGFWDAIEKGFGDSFVSNPIMKKILTLVSTEVKDA